MSYKLFDLYHQENEWWLQYVLLMNCLW